MTTFVVVPINLDCFENSTFKLLPPISMPFNPFAVLACSCDKNSTNAYVLPSPPILVATTVPTCDMS